MALAARHFARYVIAGATPRDAVYALRHAADFAIICYAVRRHCH